ncbi:MAG: glutamine ABC transporter ATP-binding protein GlnQ, partial [Acetatifactor sp.]|nr:glutamine ABC transporter ATP-binding protein GlnQ [Acetatifactor sp.]
LQVMRGLADEGRTMLVVTHEIAFARQVSNRVIFMDGGVVLEAGASGDFFAAPKEERSREFLRTLQERGA